MLKSEFYNDDFVKIYSDADKFIVRRDTNYKCVLTLDTPENFDLYDETDENVNTLVQETYGNALIRTYSNADVYVLQNETGIKYAEAIDIPNKYTYAETDEPIEHLDPLEVGEENEQ